jgi:hypothetical protein
MARSFSLFRRSLALLNGNDQAREVARVVREDLVAFFGHEDSVGVSEPADVGGIEAGLDGDTMPGLISV